ncbi:MAG: cytochrome c family protein [Myxococcaceae bacterium]|nr:cytochrome c family protein [Myxococcaceae bacterium]
MGRWFLAALALAACRTGEPRGKDAAPPAEQQHAVVVLSSELKGYVGPCGCSENMRGGLARAAAQVAAARTGQAPSLFLDLGDALFGSRELPEAAVPQQEAKARAIAKAFSAMHLDGRLPGPLDDARGEALRSSLALPEVPSGQPALFHLGKLELALVSGPDGQTLAAQAALARTRGAGFVLGAYLGPFDEALKQVTEATGVDFVVVARSKDELSGEQNRLVRAPVPMAQMQSKGRSLLRLDLSAIGPGRFELLRGAAEQERDLKALDERIEQLRRQVNAPGLADELKALRKSKLEEIIARREALAETPVAAPTDKNGVAVRFIPLESNFPEDGAVKEILTGYDREVGELNLAWAKAHGTACPAPAAGQSAYVGTARCLDCHEEAAAVWQGSKHSQALPTLEKAGKQFHLDCIGCHVTGWQRPGGTCRIDQTQLLASVGCEACHGPGSVHAEDPATANILDGKAPEGCRTCHDPENSPHFDFESYLANIIGPGHGQPAPPRPDAGVRPPPPPPKSPAGKPKRK